jgi:diguanylate cyclase (GGDEF)-like protein/PAS domain S-box-containing protein
VAERVDPVTPGGMLPDAPALLCDRNGLIVRANKAAADLANRADPDVLAGREVAELVLGEEPDLRLDRCDEPPLPIRAVRWRVPGSGLDAVLLYDNSPLVDAVDQLRVERHRLARAQGLAAMGWWEMDRDTGVAFWSDGLYRLLGLAPGSVPANLENLLARMHPDDLPVAREQWTEHVEHGSSVDVECRVVHPDGSVRWLQGLAGAADPIRRATITGFVRDVTERRRDRDQLAGERAALVEAQRIAKIGSFHYDLATGAVRRSEVMRKMYADAGMDPGDDLLAGARPELLSDYRRLSRQLIAQGSAEPVEVEVDSAVPGRVYITRTRTSFGSGGEVTGLDGTVQDVTEQRMLERQLLEDRRRFEVAQRVARLGTWEWNPATDQCVWSAMMYELLGVPDDTPATYQDFVSLVHPLDRPWVDEKFHELASRRKTVDCEYRLLRPDGSQRIFRCYGAGVQGPDGQMLIVGTAQDVTEQRVAETRMLRSSQRFTDLVSLTPVGIGLFDDSERLVDANDALCDLLGTNLERLRGRTAAQLTHPEELQAAPQPEDGLLGAGAGRHKIPQRVLVRADGEPVYCELHVATSVQDDGRQFWLVVFQDITERRRTAEALRHQATHDELTGLPNRAAVNELLSELLGGPARDAVAVLFCDIDNFKRVNDSLGHDAGDELLVALARRLEGGLPAGSTVARLSGDEYVIICADIGAVGGVQNLANRVSALLRTAVPVHGQLVRVSASIGAAVPGGGPSRGADLLRFADAAMFEAKKRGSGRVSLASAALIASADRQVHLEGQLRDALSGEGLELHYQPVVGPDGSIRTAEALIRWQHADRGSLPPDMFLPVAEQGGLLRDLDRWVLRTALREASTWPVPPGGSPIAVAVNLSGLLPGDPEFVDAVANTVAEAGIDWDRVVLELVETSLADLPARTRVAMAELVDRGVRFAVDDFGTGYSSLARLKDLPAQIIKVDRRFVAGVGSDASDFAVANAVVDMSRAMGRSCVAEGVETATQFHVLRGMGVDAYQGWLFSKALPAKEFRALAARGPLTPPNPG